MCLNSWRIDLIRCFAKKQLLRREFSVFEPRDRHPIGNRNTHTKHSRGWMPRQIPDRTNRYKQKGPAPRQGTAAHLEEAQTTIFLAGALHLEMAGISRPSKAKILKPVTESELSLFHGWSRDLPTLASTHCAVPKRPFLSKSGSLCCLPCARWLFQQLQTKLRRLLLTKRATMFETHVVDIRSHA